jgi:hypothetical protein
VLVVCIAPGYTSQRGAFNSGRSLGSKAGSRGNDGREVIMTGENFERVLNALADRKPFQVFSVELHGGRRFEVDHARAMVVRDGVAVFIAPGGGPIWFDPDRVNQIIAAPASSSP